MRRSDVSLGDIVAFLSEYDGPDMNIMEVCGSHTAAVASNGIPEIISPGIHLISGPGCPVCVTPSSYIDRLIDIAMTPGHAVVTFGDLMRVPGSRMTLGGTKGEGGRAEMVYSPLDIIDFAKAEPDTVFVFAAVGFETTAPAYALLMDQLVSDGIGNVKLLTAMKTMPEVISYLMDDRAQGSSGNAGIDAFLAPGHVSVVTGSDVFAPLAEKYRIPFAVAGFSGALILTAIDALVRNRGQGRVMNCYPSVVTREGNKAAQSMISKYFEKGSAEWRGIGEIEGSGLWIRNEYSGFDAGSSDLTEDRMMNKSCRCADVLTGRIKPRECPLYGIACTPSSPQGACMVSEEGACLSYYINQRED